MRYLITEVSYIGLKKSERKLNVAFTNYDSAIEARKLLGVNVNGYYKIVKEGEYID